MVKAPVNVMLFPENDPAEFFCRSPCAWRKCRHNGSFKNVFPGYGGSDAV